MKSVRPLFIMTSMVLSLLGTARGAVWNVHPDSVIATIQIALEFCAAGDTVIVAEGTYYENIVWPTTPGIVLMSRFGPTMTTLDGGGNGRVIDVATGVDSSTMIVGFTIRNGTDASGGGIACREHSSPSIVCNIITQNTALGSGGGGISCCRNCSPRIVGNRISENSALMGVGGGIACDTSSSPIISGNVISENFSAMGGGGIHCYPQSRATISGNIIEGNSTSGAGGGIHLVGTKAIIRNNTITENVANGGGGLLHTDYDSAMVAVNVVTYNTAFMGGGINTHYQSSPRITDNVISGNTANGGGGIFCHGENTSPAITHNVITGNRGDLGGGVHSTWYSTPIVENCELTRNNGDGVYSNFGSSPVVQFNNILSNNGYGVQNADESIVVDARFNWWGCLDGPSLAGPDRVYTGCGGTVSDYVEFRPWLRGPMGTQEYASDEVRAVELELEPNIPNPFQRITMIRFSLDHPAHVTLKIYNQAGREVATLIDGHCAAGAHSTAWDAHDQNPGLYFLRLSSDGSTATRRSLLMR